MHDTGTFEGNSPEAIRYPELLLFIVPLRLFDSSLQVISLAMPAVIGCIYLSFSKL